MRFAESLLLLLLSSSVCFTTGEENRDKVSKSPKRSFKNVFLIFSLTGPLVKNCFWVSWIKLPALWTAQLTVCVAMENGLIQVSFAK